MYSAEALERAIDGAKGMIEHGLLVKREYVEPLIEAAELALQQGYYESEDYIGEDA